jgi:hypothetical protein
MKGPFKWYWLIETEVLSAVALTIGFGLVLVLYRQPWLLGIVSVCMGFITGFAFAYQKKFYRWIGPERVHPPRSFRFLWRVVIVTDLLAVLAGVILMEVRV